MSEATHITQSIVDAWNRLYPAGTPVVYITDKGEECLSRTRSQARVMENAEATPSQALPVIEITDVSEACPLSRVMPQRVASSAAKSITIRVFVEDGLCQTVLLNNPNTDLSLEIEAEIYDGDGDCRDEYEAALAECDQRSEWKPIA